MRRVASTSVPDSVEPSSLASPRQLPWRAMTVVFGAALLTVGACKEETMALSIDLRTDFLPGTEFASVTTEVVPDGASPVGSSRTIESKGEDFLTGSRIADFGGLPPGGFSVRVQVKSASDKLLVERLARLSASKDYALTIVATRSCEGVVCPVPKGDPGLTTCLGGRCVQPTCLPEQPETCPAAECSDTRPCQSPSPCVRASCLAGTCFFVPSNDMCKAGQECKLGVGCTSSFPAPTACKSAADCDDKNPCTTDACDPATGCKHEPSAGSCDDGVFCNGADTCAGGQCSQHAGNACGQECDEAGKKCVGCATNSDCGQPTSTEQDTFDSECATTGTRLVTTTTPTCTSNVCSYPQTTAPQPTARATDALPCAGKTQADAWSACVNPDPINKPCALMGEQSLQLFTNVCSGGVCTQVPSGQQTQACPLPSVEGNTCQETEFGDWGPCNWQTECDEKASRKRDRILHQCSAGKCAKIVDTNGDSGPCERSVPNGKVCGTGKYCCGTACVDRNSDQHCGSCGISCGGGTCKGIGSGNYACTCASNTQCQNNGYGQGATCWDPTNISGTQMFCQCKCIGQKCCAGGATCKSASPGLDYCEY